MYMFLERNLHHKDEQTTKLIYRFHVNTLSISPLMPKILVQFLFGGLWYLVKADKVFDDPQISVKARRT